MLQNSIYIVITYTSIKIEVPEKETVSAIKLASLFTNKTMILGSITNRREQKLVKSQLRGAKEKQKRKELIPTQPDLKNPRLKACRSRGNNIRKPLTPPKKTCTYNIRTQLVPQQRSWIRISIRIEPTWGCMRGSRSWAEGTRILPFGPIGLGHNSCNRLEYLHLNLPSPGRKGLIGFLCALGGLGVHFFRIGSRNREGSCGAQNREERVVYLGEVGEATKQE